MGLDAAAFHDKNEDKPSEVDLSNFKIEQI